MSSRSLPPLPEVPPDDLDQLDKLLAQQGRDADREAAGLLALQVAEHAYIDAGLIDPTKGEYLARFDLSADPVAVEVGKASPST